MLVMHREERKKKKKMVGDEEGKPKEDQACEDCLSKQFIRDRLEALHQAYAERQKPWMLVVLADVAHQLGVPLDVQRRTGGEQK